MKATIKTLTFAVLGAGLIAGVLVLGMWLTGGSERTAQAQGPVIVGFDMDPTSTPANSCPNDGTTDCTLGSIETCAAVATGGGPVEFDVFLDGLPSGDSILGFGYSINEKTGTLLGPITAYTHEDGTVNLPAQPGSSMLDISSPLGTNVPGFGANVADMGAAEWNPPFTHGTLGRYTLDTAGVLDGVYGLTLSNVLAGNDLADDLCVIYGCDLWDANAGPQPYGLIAVGVACPAPLEAADVKILSQEVLAGNCTDAAPTEIDVSVDTNVCLQKTLHNNGPDGPADVTVTVDVTAPTDCTATFVSQTPVDPVSLAVSVDVTVDEVWELHCDEPSQHTFTFDNLIELVPNGFYDPISGNNSDSTDLVVDALAEAEVKINSAEWLADDCSSAAPSEIAIDADVDFCLHKVLHNNGGYGPVTVDINTGIGSPPSGCTIDPDLSNPIAADLPVSVDVTVDEIFTVSCDNLTSKSFTVTNAISFSITHLSDPNGANNDASSQLDVDVVASADVKIVSWSFPDDLGAIAGNQLLVVTAVLESLDTSETLHNNGPHTGSVDVSIAANATPAANCLAADPGNPTTATLPYGTDVQDSLSWNVTLNSGDSCNIDFSKTIAITTGGVSDPTPANNTASDSVILVLDTDGDTVPDDYDVLDDNCDTVANPDQTDTDEDGLGDACDDDDDDDTVLDGTDNCPLVDNPLQEDGDGDTVGDVCDNCPDDANTDQADTDGDTVGDVCEPAPPPQPTPSPTPTTEPTPGVTPTPTAEVVETPDATPTAVTETCAPVFPGTYNGNIRLDGVPAPSGTVIGALVGGTEWASNTVSGGLYVLDIPETLPATPPCFEGGTITFVVAGYVCSPSPDWASGLHSVDVSCELAPIATPEVTPEPGVTPTPVAPPPTGGGGLFGGGSAPWAAAVAAAGVLVFLLTAVGLSRGARRRSE